ncbi:FBD-associated F-box protein At5g38590 isoform X1 [Ziziphus jujuba]|uniref:FBD-associated F-box protein At5g38590 isoform X1 n=2 Tax=Ziziphus jujuba TaxID=326968 RepID=A0ABM4A660_ZIZJJ|nr:FBD-associated F-box protein At5g38590 isoform X1 [Ziziphus jujuba]XP_060672217.1 FBD-associated F-box protein At5g38590 isoform X1 [Ziziphus jujuba]XP_060672218.1 FBD-associated F-box protein At5g38590 isoform X1 [Ziziphus jujuba]
MLGTRMSDTMQKKHKKRKGDRGKYANLDDIPDDIIVGILSLLPLKEAVATSVLSSRWRYLWRFTRMSLDFDVDHVTPKYGTLTCLSHVTKYLNKNRKTYIRWVNEVVDQHSGAIESLRVCYYLRRRHKKHIDRWIRFGLRSNVLERLELDFSERYPFCNDMKRYLYKFFPNFFCVKYVGFKTMKVLSLRHVSIRGEEIEYLLSNATLLERLVLEECQNLSHLRVCGHSLALKHLEIVATGRNLRRVEICDLVNLVSFYFKGDFKNYARNFILRNLPLLVDFHIGPSNFYRDLFSYFSCWLPQIQFLRMTDIPKRKVYSNYDYEYPILPNIKRVHYTLVHCGFENCGGLRNLRFIMKAFPNLERLELHVPSDDHSYSDRNRHNWPAEVPNCPHYQLKEVEIFSYNYFLGDMERVLYLIKHAVALEKIIVNCKCNQRLKRFKTKQQLFEAEEISKSHAMTQLQPQIPSHIEFILR